MLSYVVIQLLEKYVDNGFFDISCVYLDIYYIKV